MARADQSLTPLAPSPETTGKLRRATKSRSLFRRLPLTIGAALLIVFALGWFLVRQVLPARPAQPTGLVTEAARQGAFRITVTERGQLSSLRNSTLASNVEGQTTIIYIVPEGTQVREGDLVCELDSSLLSEREAQQRILLTQSEAAMQQARENVEIQTTQNQSDIAAAELKLQLALLDREKFLKGEYEQQQNEMKGAITLAQEELTRAQENYDFTRRLAKKGYRSQNDLEASRIAVMQKKITLNVSDEKLRVLQQYTAKRTTAELEANATEFQRELIRVKAKAVSALTQAEADYESRKLTYEVEKSRYDRLVLQIAACKLLAPQSGTIVYANEGGGGRGGGNEEVIREGASVRERQAIINIPDLTQMKVDARVHESRIGLMRAGLPVRVRVDAFPGKLFSGVVESVASVPSSTNWFNRDIKEYDTVVRITEDAERVGQLRPGLTAEVEVIVEQRPKVLQIPIQAVVTVGPKQFAWLSASTGVERRELAIGKSNDRFIEILDGVASDDRVVLNPRTTFSDEIAELEAQLGERRELEAEAPPVDTTAAPAATPAKPQSAAPQAQTERPAENST